jgi:hypothetical protein
MRRRQPGPWTHRVMVVAVAAVILAVFFLPLPHVSLFKHLVTPAKPSTATSVPSGVSKSGALSGVSCTSATACTAVGSYDNVTLAEAWNGTKWSLEPTANPNGSQRSSLSGVSCTSATACTAVGSHGNLTLAEAWNGTKWAIEPTQNPNGSHRSWLSGVSCTSARACSAVGSYDNSANTELTLAEAWNGTKWAIEPTPNPRPSKGTHILLLGLSGVSCTSARTCTAVGGYYYLGYQVTLAEAWNGATWAIKSTPKVPGATLSGVTCTSATACVAVGGISSDGSFSTRLEAWNGNTWAVQYGSAASGTTDATSNGPDFVGVSCISVTACAVVGDGGSGTTLAEAWNGKTLTFEPTPSIGVSFRGVSCTAPTACTAVGSYDNGAGTEAPLAEAWNGKTWSVESTPRPS